MDSSQVRRLGPLVLVLGASAWLASGAAVGDWPMDSWPAVHALAQGHLGEFLGAKALMGPLSTIAEAPLAAIGGSHVDAAYGWATLPGLLAVGLLGLYLAAVARRRGASRFVQVLIAALCLINPLTLEALRLGHPEELLTGALAVGAVATAAEGHRNRAAVLLGLALASKQWAVIAILPTLMAMPAPRRRPALGAFAIAAALILPGLIAAPRAFLDVQGTAAGTGRLITLWSAWYPFGAGASEIHHESSRLIAAVAHPLIVLLVVGLPLGLAVRRRGLTISGADAMRLLALLALLRCALDPVDNLYYHAPLLLALVGCDALAPRALPLGGLLAAALALFFRSWSFHLVDPQLLNLVYLSAASTAAALLVLSLLRPVWWRRASVRITRARRLSDGWTAASGEKPDFSADEFQVSGI